MHYHDHLDEGALRKYASALNARARAAGVGAELSAAHLRGVILDSAGLCSWCGVSVVAQPFEIDHILSVTRGGGNTPDNLALACADCNRRKADKHPARYAAELLAEGVGQAPFLRRVTALYGDPEVGRQLGLFDAAPADPRPAVGLDDDDPIEPPLPYTW